MGERRGPQGRRWRGGVPSEHRRALHGGGENRGQLRTHSLGVRGGGPGGPRPVQALPFTGGFEGDRPLAAVHGAEQFDVLQPVQAQHGGPAGHVPAQDPHHRGAQRRDARQAPRPLQMERAASAADGRHAPAVPPGGHGGGEAGVGRRRGPGLCGGPRSLLHERTGQRVPGEDTEADERLDMGAQRAARVLRDPHGRAGGALQGRRPH
mmetsp:Transcript_58316/g.164657  ORF Transcript_58316/g.164657 Transcript_58316/m.164657 type:complete len:208 (-) Transcript_58316:13-636(-)